MQTKLSPYAIITALLTLWLSLAPVTGAAADMALQQVLAGDQRTPEYTARDIYRHPQETLEFMGLRPDLTVIEILPGEGWYTEVLAPYLRDGGKLIAAGYGPDHPMERMRDYHAQYMEKLDASPDVYDKVERAVLWPAPFIGSVADGSVDMVLDFRNIHNFIRWDNITEDVFRAYYRVLKPGGILGVEEHRAKPGAIASEVANTGYVPVAYVIELAQKVGFRLEGQSEINANPKDTKDYPGGVWTLLPRLRTGDEDPEKYRVIGESDRMTLKFVK